MFSKIQGLCSLAVSNACLLARTSKNTTVSRYPKWLLGGKVTPCWEPRFLKQIINTTDLWFKSSTNYILSTSLHQTWSLSQPGKPIFDPWHTSKLPLTHVLSLFHNTQTLPAGSNTLSIPVFLGLLDKCNPLLLVVVSHGLSYLLSISTRILSFLTKAPQHPLKFSASCWHSRNTGWTFQNVSISPNDTWKTGEIPYQLPFQEHMWSGAHRFDKTFMLSQLVPI